MSKGKRLTELEKFQKAVEGIDFSKISADDINTTIEGALKEAKKAELQKQIEELQKQLNEL